MMRGFLLVQATLVFCCCSGGDGNKTAPGPQGECGSVRMTHYNADESGWCGFRNSHDVLPQFVHEQMTLAIAEPYNGSSYGGEPGEACGECWEVDSIYGNQVVMVTNLCPVEGNPVCAGGHFHFDLSAEAADVLGEGEAMARRIPCPVNGNIHAEINDRNEWGFVSLAFFNQRFPIRTAEYRAVDGDLWVPLTREGGNWRILDDTTTFSDDSPGGVFRFTSPLGELVEGDQVLTYDVGVEDVFDTGTNFAVAEREGPPCEFYPPMDVYDEGYGGIEGARWEPNPWGNASMSEVVFNCAQGSESCVQVNNMALGDGFHIYYRNLFPVTTFATLSLRLRAESGSGSVIVAPSSGGTRCEETEVDFGEEWQLVEIDVAAVCSGFDDIDGVTLGNRGDILDMLFDEVFFELPTSQE